MIAPEVAGETEVGLLSTQIEAALPAVPEEHMTQIHAAAASSQTEVQKEGLQVVDNTKRDGGDPLDAGMEIDMAHLSLDDAADVDDGLLSSPGSDILPVQQTSITDSLEDTYVDNVPSLDDDSGSLRQDMDPQVLDQIERISIASPQPSRVHTRGTVDAFPQNHGRCDSVPGTSNDEGNQSPETVADDVHGLHKSSSSGENFSVCMQCTWPMSALIRGIHVIACACRHFCWGGGHR